MFHSSQNYAYLEYVPKMQHYELLYRQANRSCDSETIYLGAVRSIGSLGTTQVCHTAAGARTAALEPGYRFYRVLSGQLWEKIQYSQEI